MSVLNEEINKTLMKPVNNNLLPRVVLMACGSFSPPTMMHLRMFEVARDHLEMAGTHQVIGGIVSPTHDSYGKKGLVSAKHRAAMLHCALSTSSWIRLSTWELLQKQWSRTLEVLQFHQNYINNYIKSTKTAEVNGNLAEWMPESAVQCNDAVQVKLLCGADLLESFAVPGLWSDEDIEAIVGNHGLVVISRCGANSEKFVFESDILTKHQHNITMVTNWVPNEVSSTHIRRFLSRGMSVKYLVDDQVIEYIQQNGIFNYKPLNLPQRQTNVFCCGESGKKLQLQRTGPGQAVQVITTQQVSGVYTSVHRSEPEVSQPKRLKTTVAESV